MGYKMRCTTLFEVTSNANRKIQVDSHDYHAKCNLDTIMQIISLRCQPEEISEVSISKIKLPNIFGTSLKGKSTKYQFDFYIAQEGVFNDGVSEIGSLITDCVGVPMINKDRSIASLNITEELRNIHFEILHHE